MSKRPTAADIAALQYTGGKRATSTRTTTTVRTGGTDAAKGAEVAAAGGPTRRGVVAAEQRDGGGAQSQAVDAEPDPFERKRTGFNCTRADIERWRSEVMVVRRVDQGHIIEWVTEKELKRRAKK